MPIYIDLTGHMGNNLITERKSSSVLYLLPEDLLVKHAKTWITTSLELSHFQIIRLISSYPSRSASLIFKMSRSSSSYLLSMLPTLLPLFIFYLFIYFNILVLHLDQEY